MKKRITYISKGIKRKGSMEKRLIICSFRGKYVLTGKLAQLWDRGREEFSSVQTIQEEPLLIEMKNKDLIEYTELRDERTRYFLLSRCRLYAFRQFVFSPLLNGYDKRILFWLKRAGYPLSLAELVYLTENQVHPQKDLLGEKNSARLRQRIHGRYVEISRHFEKEMSVARSRDAVVESVVRLLRRKKIFLI